MCENPEWHKKVHTDLENLSCAGVDDPHLLVFAGGDDLGPIAVPTGREGLVGEASDLH